jgi:hypothetical protein
VPFEQAAEAAQTGEAHGQTDLGDWFIAKQQQLSGDLESMALPVLVRCFTEHGGKAADELKPGQARFGGNSGQWLRRHAGFLKLLARAAQALVLGPGNHR